MAQIINATGGWSIYGAGHLCDDARRAIDKISRVSVFMPDLHARASDALASTFGVDAGYVVNSAAAALSVTAAGALVSRSGADPRALPVSPPRRNRVILPKGHAINFSAEVTQMLALAGACPIELGAVNSCSREVVHRACQAEDVAAAYYIASTEAFPYGVPPLADYVDICHRAGILVIVDAAAQPSMRPFIDSGADAVIASPHKLMGSPTCGLILGRREFIEACRAMEGNFARPFKASKETISGAIAATRWWTGRVDATVHEEWQDRSDYCAGLLSGLTGITYRPFYYPAPLEGIYGRVEVDAEAFGMNAREVADALKSMPTSIVFVEEEADQGALLMHFSMLPKASIDAIAASLRALSTAPAAA